MQIKNKFLRFIVSVLITLSLYFLLAMVLSQGDIEGAIEAMFIFAIFGIFIVVPTLIFMTYLAYQLLTVKNKRSKKLLKTVRNSIIYLSIIALLYMAAMYTDLFG